MTDREYNIEVPDEISKRKISDEEKEQIRENGRSTEKLKDFYSDTKKCKFDAFVVVKNGKLQLDQIEFHNERKKPITKEIEPETYQVPKKVFGVKLSDEQREVLSKPNQETELIKGFKRKDQESGNTMEFDAHLSISKDKNDKYNLNFKYIEIEKKQEKVQDKTENKEIQISKKPGKNKGMDL